jgi:23S rRNA pseudouridine1911/1915/1917 synthase
MSPPLFHLSKEHDGLSLGQALKRLKPDESWSQVRKLIAARRVQVNGNLCLDEGRRVKAGDVLKIAERSLAKPAEEADIRLVNLDVHLLVVQKPAGVTTLRHREETDLPPRRKQLQPTLDELLPRVLVRHLGIAMPDHTNPKRQRGSDRFTRGTATTGRGFDKRLAVRAVHRLDRDTSGLMIFARSPEAEQKLIRMFAKHAVQRAYVAVVHGQLTEPRTIDTWLARDRGDGLRGSIGFNVGSDRRAEPELRTDPAREIPPGSRNLQRAITHVRPMEQLTGYTLVECRLETGRTHQIRIHLSEISHMLCGEQTYPHAPGQKPQADASGAPRQALHAAEIAFTHPITNQPLRFRMPLQKDLKDWLLTLRGSPRKWRPGA